MKQSCYESQTLTNKFFIKWLEDINFIREGAVNALQLSQIMYNGYFLGKLINRLEGKEDLIKGLEQDPKNISRLRNNWTKVLEFLKKKSKFVCLK